jgi:hypothetical protein
MRSFPRRSVIVRYPAVTVRPPAVFARHPAVFAEDRRSGGGRSLESPNVLSRPEHLFRHTGVAA